MTKQIKLAIIALTTAGAFTMTSCTPSKPAPAYDNGHHHHGGYEKPAPAPYSKPNPQYWAPKPSYAPSPSYAPAPPSRYGY